MLMVESERSCRWWRRAALCTKLVRKVIIVFTDICHLLTIAVAAGTLSGNPLAMAAGIETLTMLKKPGSYERLSALSSRLVQGIINAGKEFGHDMSGGYINGMFGFFFTKGPVRNFDDAKKQDLKKFARWHRLMLERGVYLAPSAYEAGFMSLAHTEDDIDKTIATAREVMRIL